MHTHETASVVAADPAATTGGDPGPTVVTPPPVAGDRYHLGEEIARGGMGAVYRATDTTFGREVAVKVLLDKYTPTSAAARRFFDEARITAQLQHPGIPPVFDLGTLADGRPFLAMKLIKGDTLDDLLKGNPDRGRLVAAFEAVCQAVGYAHAHGVVHRDLKPANVMVGSFGEVQVMDWGLAKVLADTRPAPADDPETTAATGTAVRSLRDSEDLLTQAGSVLGTPAYMAPEQALGAVHEVDARTDVFGLGGILAAALTGRPPFVGDTAETTRVMAARGELSACFARLAGCGADPELVALCKRCLSPRREDRPADAGAVAAEVAALRAAADERARQAELERVKAEGEVAAAAVASAERRKRRRVWQAAGGVLVAVLAVGVTGTTWGLLEARRERDAADALRQAESEARQAADANADKARASEAVAKKQALLALSTIQLVITEVDDKLAAAPNTAALRITLLQSVEKKWDEIDVALTGGDRGEAVGTLMAVRAKLADVWLSLEMLGNADSQYRKLYDLAQERVILHKRSDTSRYNLAFICQKWGKVRHRISGDPKDKDRLLEQVVELTQEIRRDPRPQPGSPAGYLIADLLQQALMDQANAAVRAGGRAKATKLYAEVGKVNMDVMREMDEKASWFTKLEPSRQVSLRAYYAQNLLIAQAGQANGLCALGKVDEAIVSYRSIVERSRAMAAAAPEDRNAREQHAMQLRNFGQYMLRVGRLGEAKTALLEAVKWNEMNYAIDPVNATYKKQYHYSLYSAGVTLEALGMGVDARRLLQRARDLRAELAAAAPDVKNKYSLVLVEARLGNTNQAKAIMGQMLADPINKYEMRLSKAQVYSQLTRHTTGTERDECYKIALETLEAYLVDNKDDVFDIITDWELVPVRDTPQFREIIAKLKPAADKKQGQ